MAEKNVFILKYMPKMRDEWNRFNKIAKNGLFMFDRDYMEYHSDRFSDHSLLFYYKDALIALLPANISEGTLYSHQGLTYGGFIVDSRMKQHIMNECFAELCDYLTENNIHDCVYKTVPHIFHRIPAEEDKYTLFINRAVLEKTEAATVIALDTPVKMPKGRKSQINRAQKKGIEIMERTGENSFRDFFALEEYVLQKYHNKTPAHTADEMILLRNYFPKNIRLYSAEYEKRMLAGLILYEYPNLIHTQYMAVDEEGRKDGALDLLIAVVTEQFRMEKKWLDFGISTEDGGKFLNEGLISQKEGFGGRTVVYETYRLSIPVAGG